LESQIKTGKHADSKGNMSLLGRAANPSKTADDITEHKKATFPIKKKPRANRSITNDPTAHCIIHIKFGRRNSSAEESKTGPQLLITQVQVYSTEQNATISTSF